MHNDLAREDMSNLAGTSIAMNNNGNFIAVGAQRAIIAINGGIAIRGGHVRTYAFNVTVWTPGQDFDAEAAGDSMGFSVAVNGDGSIIACAAPEGDPNGVNSGYVHVYIAQGNNLITPNNYIRLGDDLDGNSGDRFGQSIAINDAGTRLIIGAPGGNYVKVFQKETFGDPWSQLGETIMGGGSDRLGSSVDINAAGDRIVIGNIGNVNSGSGSGGAPFADANGSDSGYSAVYDFKTALSLSDLKLSNNSYTIYPNPSSTVVTIVGDVIKQVDIINVQGKILATTYTNILDVTQFSTGFYFVKITSKEGLIFEKKLLIN